MGFGGGLVEKAKELLENNRIGNWRGACKYIEVNNAILNETFIPP